MYFSPQDVTFDDLDWLLNRCGFVGREGRHVVTYKCTAYPGLRPQVRRPHGSGSSNTVFGSNVRRVIEQLAEAGAIPAEYIWDDAEGGEWDAPDA